MTEHDPVRQRWALESPDDPAAKLLGQALRPTLTPSQLARVRMRLDESTRVTPAVSPRRPLAQLLLALTIGVIGGAAGYAQLHSPSINRPQSAGLGVGEGVRLELLGPGQVIAGRGDASIQLGKGSLLVQTTSRRAIIEEAQARLTVPLHAIVEVVSARGRPTLIVSYVGQAMVRWAGKEQEILLAAGSAATAAGPVALPLGRLQRVLTWLAKGESALGTALQPLGVQVDPAGVRAVEAPAAVGAAAAPMPPRDEGKAESAPTGSGAQPPSGPLSAPGTAADKLGKEDTRADAAKKLPPPKRIPAPGSRIGTGQSGGPRAGPAPAGADTPAGRRPAVAPSRAAPPAAAEQAGEDAVLRESELLGKAMARLRQAHDPSGALTLLDAYHGQFPQGVLQPEADLLRVTALLNLGKRRDALAVLDPRPLLDDTPRGMELRVMRGELRAEAGRCPAAIADFDAAIGQVQGTLLERGLYGRSRCRAQGGDLGGARADLIDYLRRFPAGRFSTEARKTLGTASP